MIFFPIAHRLEKMATIGAVRISDGKRVFLKRINTLSREIDIHRFMSEPEKLKDPRNHTVPLLDVFADEDDPSFSYLVMPLLRPHWYPEFSSVDEVLEFMSQLFEVRSTLAFYYIPS